MDFFAHQDAARRQTRRLIFLFTVAVILLVAIVSATITYVILPLIEPKFFYHDSRFQFGSLNAIRVLSVTAITTLTIIVIGSIYKIMALSSGGKAVATSLGGRLLNTNTQVFEERQLLNVIEEMAIASGVPVPSVYLLDDEQGINAFAAGFTVNDAVIGVTKGALNAFSRDQLQGVIAHEFSHILNGDMRLNLRAMGVLHGIIVMALIGEILFRLGANSNRSSRNSSRNSDSRIMLVFFLIGLCLIILGRIGLIGARFIKSAISRQREFLADASAVQFTRNPQGIGGALRKILETAGGSKIISEHAEESSHLFFSNALASSWSSLLATHPPLKERILRIDKQILTEDLAESDLPTEDKQGISQLVSGNHMPRTEHVIRSQALLNGLPREVSEAARETFTARCIVYLMLLSEDPNLRQQQRDLLSKSISSSLFEVVVALERVLPEISTAMRLPLVDLSLPAIRVLSDAQQREFFAVAKSLVQQDKQLSFFEYVLLRIVFKSTDQIIGKKAAALRRPALNHHDLELVLSMLAWIEEYDVKKAGSAFRAGAESCRKIVSSQLTFLDRSKLSLEGLDNALDRLDLLTPKIKREIFTACVATVMNDKSMAPREYELLRVIGAALDTPLPIGLNPTI